MESGPSQTKWKELGLMSMDEVGGWLVSLGCPAGVVAAFREHDINGCVLVGLTDTLLKNEMHIGSLGIRTRIMRAIGEGIQDDAEATKAQAAVTAASSAGSDSRQATLQLEPAEAGASHAAERERKRPAAIDVFSLPLPRLPSTPKASPSGSAGTNVSLSPDAFSHSSIDGTSSDRSSADGTDVEPPTSADSSVPPRSPQFILSPKLQGSLAPEQLQLREFVQAGDAAGVDAILKSATAGGSAFEHNKRKLWANTVDEQGFTLLMEAVALEDVSCFCVQQQSVRRCLTSSSVGVGVGGGGGGDGGGAAAAMLFSLLHD